MSCHNIDPTVLLLFGLVSLAYVFSLTVVLSEWWCAAMAPSCLNGGRHCQRIVWDCLSSGDRLRGVGSVAEDFV